MNKDNSSGTSCEYMIIGLHQERQHNAFPRSLPRIPLVYVARVAKIKTLFNRRMHKDGTIYLHHMGSLKDSPKGRVRFSKQSY